MPEMIIDSAVLSYHTTSIFQKGTFCPAGVASIHGREPAKNNIHDTDVTAITYLAVSGKAFTTTLGTNISANVAVEAIARVIGSGMPNKLMMNVQG